uniref:NADH-ubiquinone oxidoreductase chain 6 n=1 Tax=Antennarius striatus TaxID=241820 RepID=D3KRA5_ANTSR|nr:NADH dehydrogenase subunit 6 [Antennarius striatus]
MTLTMFLLFFGWMLGSIIVSSNPSPYFAAFGLVLSSGLGCAILAGLGGPFLSLILFLVYLGGMLVVFAYTAALAAEPYPEGLGSIFVLPCIFFYSIVFLAAYYFLFGSDLEVLLLGVEEVGMGLVWGGDAPGVGFMYSLGGGLLVMSAWALLMTLLIVLELTRGGGRGGFRAL